MWAFLDKIPYGILILFAILLLLLPFKPMPHALEKLIMLTEGSLARPIDIFISLLPGFTAQNTLAENILAKPALASFRSIRADETYVKL